jgi:O-antigen/teichoic acid export membrane protein
MANNIAALALNIGLNIWLIPRYGIVGAGVAWASSLIVINLSRVVQVYVTMGMLPFDRGMAKGAVAAAAALPVAWLVHSTTSGWSALVGGFISVTIVYAGMCFVLGLDPQDRLLWSSVTRWARAG